MTRRDAGFTLLEVLISLLVISIGLMGVAAMDVRSVRMVHGSLLRSQAIVQAQYIADRMHANQAGVDAGHYTDIGGVVASPPTCRTSASSTTIDCTPEQIAAHDAHEWYTANALLLPAGAGSVTGPDPDTGVYVITVSWQEIEAAGAEAKSFSFDFKPLPPT